MTFTNNASEVLVSGQQNKLYVVNNQRGTLLNSIESTEDIVVMRKSRLIVCGTANGKQL